MTRNCRLFIIFFVSWWTHFRKWITSKLPHQFRTNLPWNCMEMHEFTYRKSFEICELWINIELYWYMKSSDILRYLISYISKLLYLQWFSYLRYAYRTNSAPIQRNEIPAGKLVWGIEIWRTYPNKHKMTIYFSTKEKKIQHILLILEI